MTSLRPLITLLTIAAASIGAFARGSTSEQAAGRGWFAGAAGWILDLDLDYFVADCESPKMHGPPAQPFDEHLERRFDIPRLLKVQEFLHSKGVGNRETQQLPLGSRVDAAYPMDFQMLEYDLLIADPVVPPAQATLRARVAALEKALRRSTSTPPALVTLVRSNVGGYTATPHSRGTAYLASL